MSEDPINPCVVNPRYIIDNGYVSRLINKKIQMQPNGIDLTIETIREIPRGLELDFTNDKRHVPEGRIIFDSRLYDAVSVVLNEHHVIKRWLNHDLKPYLVTYHERIEVPENMSAIVIHRSSVIRGAAFLTSSWYDSGYKGYGNGCLYAVPGMKIWDWTRIAQIIYYYADPAYLYNGKYQEEGMQDEKSQEEQ